MGECYLFCVCEVCDFSNCMKKIIVICCEFNFLKMLELCWVHPLLEELEGKHRFKWPPTSPRSSLKWQGKNFSKLLPTFMKRICVIQCLSWDLMMSNPIRIFCGQSWDSTIFSQVKGTHHQQLGENISESIYPISWLMMKNGGITALFIFSKMMSSWSLLTCLRFVHSWRDARSICNTSRKWIALSWLLERDYPTVLLLWSSRHFPGIGKLWWAWMIVHSLQKMDPSPTGSHPQSRWGIRWRMENLCTPKRSSP